jgi:hypothetical protein
MSQQRSFSKYEQELLPQYRNRLNTAESTTDVQKFFVYTVQELMRRVFQDRVDSSYDEIRLLPGEQPQYGLSEAIRKHPEFESLAADSDLLDIFERLASAASKRYQNLQRHPDKSESKIRA